MDEDRKYKVKLTPGFKWKWGIIFSLFFMLSLSTELGFAFYHEEVHGAIYNNYGVNYVKGFMFDPNAYYMPAFYVKTIDETFQMCNEVCGSLQVENEIIGYNASAIIIAFFTVVFIYLIKGMFDDHDKLARDKLQQAVQEIMNNVPEESEEEVIEENVGIEPEQTTQ